MDFPFGTTFVGKKCKPFWSGKFKKLPAGVKKMDIVVVTYAAYIVLSVMLTVWVARTLHTNGRIFLVDVFGGNESLADSVNHLLVVGFYLINLGFISLFLKLGYDIATARQGIEALSFKVGTVLIVLGAMHFFNLFVFTRIRHRNPSAPQFRRPASFDKQNGIYETEPAQS